MSTSTIEHPPTPERVRDLVRERYGERAERADRCCGDGGGDATIVARTIGYSDGELGAVPEGANLGLGCGNPIAHARLRPGETVLDLGSGAGFDAFLAARAVGDTGHVIGVDMTPQMVAKAEANARSGGFTNVEFRLGTIEALPVADAAVDVVISNCVINLSPEKPRVFREAFRVLKPGGRLLVSDIVLGAPLPPQVLASVEAYVGCIAGASLKAEYLAAIAAAGFTDVEVIGEADGSALVTGIDVSDPIVAGMIAAVGGLEAAREVARSVVSARVAARKPV
jgi:arsenite methyltransferase